MNPPKTRSGPRGIRNRAFRAFTPGTFPLIVTSLLSAVFPFPAQAAIFVDDTFSADTRSQYTQVSENSGNKVYSDEGFNFLSSDGMVSLRMHRKNNRSALNYGTRLGEINQAKFPISATSSATITLTLGNSSNVPKTGGAQTVNGASPISGTGAAQIRFGIVASLSSRLNSGSAICVQALDYSDHVTIQLRVANTTLSSVDVNNGAGWAGGDKIILTVQNGQASVQYIDQSSGQTYTPIPLTALAGVSFSSYLNGGYAAFDIGNSAGISPGQEFNTVLVVDAFRADSDTIQPPAGIAVLETSETASQISWNASSTATSYEVFRDGVSIGAATGLSLADSGPLDKYRSYEYTVKATNAAGQSSNAGEPYVFAYKRFPFVMPGDAAPDGTVTDMSTWSPGPAANRITVANGHLSANGQPIKLLGVNLVFSAKFPSKIDPVYGDLAEKVAARMARLGINAVRLHALDTTTPSGLYASNNTSLDSAQLDKLDYFVSRLKAHGIYIDINLVVSQGYPGFSKTNFPAGSNLKGVDLYMPGMIQRQKDFANALLGHANPYTGATYAADPCVAFVEINNENGLIRAWRDGLFNRDINSSYFTELASQWNTWLSSKYADTTALTAAWTPAAGHPYGTALLTNGDFATGSFSPWSFYVTTGSATATKAISSSVLSPDGGPSLEIEVTQASTNDTHIQLYQGNLSLTGSQPYTISFWAKADSTRVIPVKFLQNTSPWAALSPTATFTLTSNWQRFTYCPTATGSFSNGRLQITGLAGLTGKVWFADFEVSPGNTFLGASSAFAEGISGSESLTNGNFASAFASPWALQVTSPSTATQTIVPGGGPSGQNALEINVTTADTTSGNGWHVQFFHSGLSVQSGQPYTLTFWAKAETPRSVVTRFLKSTSPWGLVSSNQPVLQIGTTWQQHTVVLVGAATESSARLEMTSLASVAGKISFADISLKTGTPGIGLLAGESLGTVGLFPIDQIALRNRAAQKDWFQFLWDTEQSYWTTMRDYLKNAPVVGGLGNQSLLIGTQASFSPPLIQSQFDVVDIHSYWQHPSFPGTAWDGNNWYMKNIPMAGAAGGVTIPKMAATRVTGKPFICTEYNHCSPNTFVGETFLIASAYAAFQGWDAIFAYNYLHTTEWDTGFFDKWFQISQEPTKLVSLTQAAAIMKSGGVSPGILPASATISASDAVTLAANGSLKFGMGSLGVDDMQGMVHPLGIAAGTTTQLSVPDFPASQTSYVSDTGELEWDTTDKLFTINTTKVKTIVGQTGQQLFDFGDGVTIQPAATMQPGDWAAISMMVKEGTGFTTVGSRLLITATGYCDNHKMIWKPGMGPADATSSVGAQWGGAPTLLEGITATVSLPLPAANVTVWALDENGQHKTSVPVTSAGGKATFMLDLNYETAWYEVLTAY